MKSPQFLKYCGLWISMVPSITIEAMGTQLDIAEQIVDCGGDYVLALKGNQGTLHEEVISYVDQHVNNDFADIPVRRLEEKTEKGHGRLDSRIYIQFSVPDSFKGRSHWKCRKTIGLVVYNSQLNGNKHIEIRNYISSLAQGINSLRRSFVSAGALAVMLSS